MDRPDLRSRYHLLRYHEDHRNRREGAAQPWLELGSSEGADPLMNTSKIHRQIAEESARLVLEEFGTVEAQVPIVSIGQILDLQTKRRRGSQ
jgi:hypothetical protein